MRQAGERTTRQESKDGRSRRCKRTHVRRPEERRAGVAPRHGHDGAHHEMLDERSCDDDGDLHVVCGRVGSLVDFVDQICFCCYTREPIFRRDRAKEASHRTVVSITGHDLCCVGSGNRRCERLLEGDVHMLVHLLV